MWARRLIASRWPDTEKLPAGLGSLQMTNLNAYAGKVSKQIDINLVY